MSDKLVRPFNKEELADNKRITCWNNFEDVCMRHMTFRKSPNQPESVMRPFYPIVKRISKRYYYLFEVVFSTVGYNHEDLESYGKIYLINFLGMKRRTKEEFDDEKFKLFTSYLKQRFGELATICNRKNKNVLGSDDKIGLFRPIEGRKVNHDAPDECIYDNPEIFGFRRIGKQEFLEEVKALGGGKKARQKVMQGIKNISVGPRELHSSDIENTDLDFRNNIHTMSPESYLIKEEQDYFSDTTGLKKILNEMDPNERMKLLKNAFKNIREKDMKKALKALIESYKEINCG